MLLLASENPCWHTDITLLQYEIYLFESILLCCKEVSSTKSKDKKDKTRSTGPRMRNRNAKLHLKGRIFMTNVTDVVSLSRPGKHRILIHFGALD